MTSPSNRPAVLWRGPSPVDGARLRVIVAARPSPSRVNLKTGAMLQAYIQRVGRSPVVHRRLDAKRSQCGDCPLADSGACYVRPELAPLGLYRTARVWDWSGLFESDRARWAELVSGLGYRRAIRIGADGDPAMVPVIVWTTLLRRSLGWTGYTHQTRHGNKPDGFTAHPARLAALRPLIMASTQDPERTRAAWRDGWRTYRVRPVGAPLLAGEIQCPAARGVRCADCRLCSGTSVRAPSISIEAHGGATQKRSANEVAQP